MLSVTIPQKPKFNRIDENTSKFVIEGCYPGYGTTLGNALRRVLLSSLSGAAITSVKIKGIAHEFSTLPNVKEDVIQIILNLKQVRFKMHSEEPVKVSLNVKGEKAVKAGMIDCPSQVEVMNKDKEIATITNQKGELDMEMEIGSGIGYVPVEQQDREKKEVGIIAVDAIYTPIRRVNYVIENMRVGKKTDYERINLEIATDGTITPEDAFLKAVNILSDQFAVLQKIEEKSDKIEGKGKDESQADGEKSKPEEEDAVEVQDPKKIAVKDLRNLSTRTFNVLEKNKIDKIGDIVKFTEGELTELDGMGSKGLKEIKKSIGDFGLNLKKEK